jgi:hypothetical protein
MKKCNLYIILISLLWAGMIIGISFLEAPTKFTAPSLTLAIGLDVGRHVFAMFNKIELIWATLLIVLLFVSKPQTKITTVIILPAIILLLQTFWLLPALDQRALVIINGGTNPESSIHLLYILFEFIKAVSLILAGVFTINSIESKN